MTTYAEAETLLDDVWSNVKKAVGALEDGSDASHISIEKDVKNLCSVITTMKPDDAKIFAPKLQELIKFLSDISSSLAIKKKEIEEELNFINKRSSAHNAYFNANMNAIATNNNEDD